MTGLKRFIRTTDMKTRAVSILLTVAILGGSFIWLGNSNMDNVSAEGSEKTYMEYIIDRMVGGLQDEFRILEIVPYDGQGEFRYFIGADEVEEGLESRQDMLEGLYGSGFNGDAGIGNYIVWNTGRWTNEDKWQKLNTYYSNLGYELRYNSYEDKFEVRGPEIFLNNVLPDYAGILADRIHLDTVEANDLTAEVIEQADMIIISTGTHDGNTLKAYSAWSGVYGDAFYTSDGAVTASSDYDTYERVTAEDGTVSYVSRDASWEMCEVLLDYIIGGRDLQLSDGTVIKNVKTPVILDNKEAGYLDRDGNIYKLGLMYRMLAKDRYEAIKPALSTTYMAEDGTEKQYINSKNMVTVALDTTATGTFDESTAVLWGAGSDENNNPIVKFFNTLGNGGYSSYYDGNPFSPVYLTDDYWIYSGDSVLIPVNSGVTQYVSGSPGFTERTGAQTTTEGILQYLLGAKPSQTASFDYTMKVLEVQPCNSFDYDTFEEVKALGRKLLMEGADSWTEENYRNYLDVCCVTTNALNGMTEDLISEYDMIIIGENIELLNKDSDGRTIYNDRNLNGYIYLAYGDLFKIATNYLGILPEDYQELKNTSQTGWFTNISEGTRYLYTDYVYSSLVENGGTGKVYINKNMYEYYKLNGGVYGKSSYDSSTGELYLDYSLGNVRGADNDITDLTKERLIRYAQSGKIIVLSDSLYKPDGSVVYPTSDIYDLASALSVCDETGRHIYSVIRQQYIGGAVLYLTDEVPRITMYEKPAEPQYTDGVISQFGSRELTYRFNLLGSYGKTYNIKLYIDKNCDGVFKGIEQGASDDRNELYFSKKVTLTGGNATDYTIECGLADNFVGMLSWKLEVIQLDDAGNETALASSVCGYSAIRNETPEDIRVLQILPMQNVTLNMAYNNPASTTDFQDLLREIEAAVGYNITIDTMNIAEFEALYAPNAAGDNSYTQGEDINTERDKLRSYDMVVIGFADMYGYTVPGTDADITNRYGALDNILDFMDIGKSVLFTHDTLSWRATPNHVTSTVNGTSRVEMWDTYTLDAWGNQSGGRSENFAYELTIALRDRVGLDKYGITLNTDEREGKEVPVYSSKLTAPNYATQAADGKYYVNELQGFNTWNIYRGNFLKHFVSQYDYSRRGLNCIMPYTNTEWFSENLWTTTQVVQLNEGAITMYPYAIDEKLTVAKTHAQYYELDMEDEDIVVWYTLSDDGTAGGGYYECTEKDAGNNYYIYSKNNITYSGAGHSTMSSEMELRLFVNTIVKAIAGGNNEPECMVTNGAVGAGGIYIVHTNSVNAAGEYQMDIRAIDSDLVSYEDEKSDMDLVGSFKEANVYWVLPDGTELLIKSYKDSNPLKNGLTTILRLADTSLTAAQLGEIEALVEESDGEAIDYAEFRIEVYDWLGAKDEITVRLVERELFELE